MCKLDMLIKGLKDNGVQFSVKGEGVYWTNYRIYVQHGELTAVVKFDTEGEFFQRLLYKKGMLVMASDGFAENSLYGAYQSLVNPKADLEERIASLRNKPGRLSKGLVDRIGYYQKALSYF